ncbi:MAG: Ig-like domain-containing protein [Bacteroidales bacterium]|nr:Ig-like domain-containing protein [Bacteroidales bacterium]
MRRNIIIGAIMVLLVAAIAGCAKQGYPSGGPKDEQPPKAVGTKPANESRNFDARQFSISFDEYITVKDPDNNVLVSPPMREKPEYITKGKRLVVKLNDTLQPDATYLFQFKGAIVDYNEGNVMPSFEYVFSTGERMDTMMLAGRVLAARDGKPWKETVTVMAYKAENGMLRAEDDTIALSRQPDYITRCDRDGVFAFHYIPAGSYRLVAVEDKNRDLRVGLGESAAWEHTLVQASDSIDSTNVTLLRLSAPDRNEQRVVKAEFTSRGRVSIATMLPMKNPTLTGDSMEWRLNERRDTMMVWFRNAKCDSTVLVLNDGALQDTMKLRYRAPRQRRRRGSQQQTQSEALVRPLCSGDNAFYDDLRLAFTTPVAAMADGAQVEVMRIKDSSISYYPIELDSSALGARIKATLRSGEEYNMRLRDSLFTDIFGRYSDSLAFRLTPRDYGILALHITNITDYPVVVEVLDKNDSVVAKRSVVATDDVRIDHLKADEYRLRAVLDIDGSGDWTTGDYLTGRQPEYVVYFGKSLKLREKWELEERWMLTKTDFGRK